MDDGEFELARADRAVAGLMGIADLLDCDLRDARVAAAVRVLALELDETLGSLRAAMVRNCDQTETVLETKTQEVP